MFILIRYRRFFWAAIAFVFFSAFNNSKTAGIPVSKPGNSNAQKQSSKISDSGNQRSALIEDLKKLQAAFASGDGNRIRKIFRFPLDADQLSVSVEDSTFDQTVKKNGDRISGLIFDRYFAKLSRAWQLKELNMLFKLINVNGLNKKDDLEYHAILKKEPCYKQYSVRVEDSVVTLTYGWNSNPDYVNKPGSSGDSIGDDCEFDFAWIFRFDGKDLVFLRQVFAG